jgi:SAM-dependent methyltransferase
VPGAELTTSSEAPGTDRRYTPLSSPTYAVRAPLADWLRRQARDAAEAYGRYRLLDVGSGIKPYLPFFEPYVAEYVGVDVAPGSDLQGSVEELPVPDASFDVVLCTQVLEHCDDPARAVRELRRVVRPGGRVLASTHGTMVYHPAPQDFWRWTHTGLERLFDENGEWSSVTVRPGSGTTACVGMLVSLYLDLLFHRMRLRPLGRPLVAGVNRAARAIDGTTALLREPVPGSLFANYHVEARA